MSFATFVMDLVKPVITRAVVSLGFGTVTYAGASAAMDALLNSVKGALGGLTGDASALLAMAGIFTSISIIAGALTSTLALTVLKKFALRTGG